MTRSRSLSRLTIQALEDRLVPSVGTFVEDFTNDYHLGRGGYDTAKDHVKIAAYPGELFGASFVKTPIGGPAGVHSLRLSTSASVSLAQYMGWIYHNSEPGSLAPWEQVTGAAVTVRGVGKLTFIGRGSYASYDNIGPDAWAIYRVNANTIGVDGRPLGQIDGVYASTRAEMLLDDVTVDVSMDATQFESDASVVKVWRFGNGLGIAGDNRDNLVRVDFLYDADGTIRVTGLAGTRIVAGTPDVTQVSNNEVTIANFARIEDDDHRRDDRDLFINLNGGDDVLEILGADVSVRETTIDDLFVNMGSGDSLVEMNNVMIYDAMSFRSESGSDHLTLTGHTIVWGLNVHTGAGEDEVRIGAPGAMVFDGEEPDDVFVGRASVDAFGHTLNRRNSISTGAGRDTVVLAGGEFKQLDCHLGTSDDRFRVESAIWSGYLYPGQQQDLIEFKESMINFRLVLADIHDVLRYDRVVGYPNGLLNRITGASVTVELPHDGTKYRPYPNSHADDWSPSLPPGALLNNVRITFEEPSRNRIAKVRFALFEF
jgi:hypothetical protein